MIEAYKKFWEGYVDFEGRSTRSDYWFAYLVNALITWGLYIVVAVFGGIASATDSTVLAIFSLILGLIMFIYAVAAFLPGLAVTVRRLRDAGYNWPYIFVAFIPLVGCIILIGLLCKPSKVEYPFNNFNNPQQ